uniref:Uncharacterized protein n=1 Tax=Oryza sativa subsp. japonica TaxID=39947 RepID=Q84T25_ORYSJ|nr:hypothetical protein [Oryza sativa Japonica Group]
MPSSHPCSCCRLPSSPPHRPGHHRPLVIPGRHGVRPSVKPIAFRQVCCSLFVVFVLGSVSSSLVQASSRLRPRITTEVIPSPFASVVPEPSPPRPFVIVVPRLVLWW